MIKKQHRNTKNSKPDPKTPEQIPFRYSHSPILGLVEGVANRDVLTALRRENWATGRLAVIGPAQSGKSTLARQIASTQGVLLGTPKAADAVIGSATPLIVIDDVDRFLKDEGGERALFHLINDQHQYEGKIVVFSKMPLDELPVELADLRSRLGTFESLAISQPDDDMIVQLIAKGFEERGVFVKPDVIAFIAARVERTYDAVSRSVTDLDLLAIRDKGKITKARASQYFNASDEVQDE